MPKSGSRASWRICSRAGERFRPAFHAVDDRQHPDNFQAECFRAFDGLDDEPPVVTTSSTITRYRPA